MRILIFLLALTSAFFVSAQTYDPSDLVEPYKEPVTTYDCQIGSITYSSSTGLQDCYQNNIDSFLSLYPSPSECPSAYVLEETYSTNTVNFQFQTFKYTYKCFSSGIQSKAIISNPTTSDGESCPPPSNPDYDIDVNIDGKLWCAKSLEPDPDCPAPTDNDPFVFGSGGGQTSVCFPAQNGRQCEIQTDGNGGYYIPASYGSAEPVSCIPDIDPSPDPDPTPDPEPKPDPEPTDPTPEPTELDAINKINENLDVLNQNQSASSESNDERLDRIALEIQNSNELLSAIKGKPVSGGGSNINNGALTEIAENTKPKEFNFNANRKQGGLNDIFTGDDLAQVEQEIEDKKTELADYIEKIKSESKAIFDINTNISGSYIEHKETIKGAEVDLGVGRFSGFFQIIAPALIFVATVAALFIMLGGNKE